MKYINLAYALHRWVQYGEGSHKYFCRQMKKLGASNVLLGFHQAQRFRSRFQKHLSNHHIIINPSS